MKRILLVVVAAFAQLSEAAEPVDFAHDVLPLLRSRCAQCHTNGTYKGSVSMDTRTALLKSDIATVGDSADSELIERVTSDDPDLWMPPKGERLSDEQVAVLRAWIDEGLSWQEGFSFKATSYLARLKPRRPQLPPVAAGRHNPIDRIVDKYYADKMIAPPQRTGDANFMRRLHLDVVGTLPSPDDLETFVADADPEKREKLIQRLLDDRRAYADHWLTFWNDLLRNDYAGTGYIDGGRKQITGWLYQALVENKPYDQFVRELIHPTPDSEGFIRGIKWRGRVNASQTREIQFAQNVSQVFLGINLKCASCHDSFIDDWKLADAYGLAAITSDKPLEIHRCDKPTGVTAGVKFLFPELGSIDPKVSRAERLQQLAALMTHADNGRLTRTIVNRLWQRLMGRGIVEPVDIMSNPPWSEDLLDYLAVHLSDHDHDLKKLIGLIVSSEAYQAQCATQTEESNAGEYVFRGPIARRMTAEQFLDAVWSISGTAPTKAAAQVKFPAGDRPRTVRAALVKADFLMRGLGRPNREQVVTTRPAQLTTLQALDLSNGQILADTLTRGARHLRQQHPDWSPTQMVDWIYRSALCREPTDDEKSIAQQIVDAPATDEGLADLLWVVFMLPEFQMIR